MCVLETYLAQYLSERHCPCSSTPEPSVGSQPSRTGLQPNNKRKLPVSRATVSPQHPLYHSHVQSCQSCQNRPCHTDFYISYASPTNQDHGNKGDIQESACAEIIVLTAEPHTLRVYLGYHLLTRSIFETASPLCKAADAATAFSMTDIGASFEEISNLHCRCFLSSGHDATVSSYLMAFYRFYLHELSNHFWTIHTSGKTNKK